MPTGGDRAAEPGTARGEVAGWMERGDPGFRRGIGAHPGQGGFGKPSPCRQAAVRSDSPGFPGKELRGAARTRALPPHRLAALQRREDPRFLSLNTSKGRAAPAAILMEQFPPLSTPHTSANTATSEPAGLPPSVGTGGSGSTTLQVQPPPHTSGCPTAVQHQGSFYALDLQQILSLKISSGKAATCLPRRNTPRGTCSQHCPPKPPAA